MMYSIICNQLRNFPQSLGAPHMGPDHLRTGV